MDLKEMLIKNKEDLQKLIYITPTDVIHTKNAKYKTIEDAENALNQQQIDGAIHILYGRSYSGFNIVDCKVIDNIDPTDTDQCHQKVLCLIFSGINAWTLGDFKNSQFIYGNRTPVVIIFKNQDGTKKFLPLYIVNDVSQQKHLVAVRANKNTELTVMNYNLRSFENLFEEDYNFNYSFHINGKEIFTEIKNNNLLNNAYNDYALPMSLFNKFIGYSKMYQNDMAKKRTYAMALTNSNPEWSDETINTFANFVQYRTYKTFSAVDDINAKFIKTHANGIKGFTDIFDYLTTIPQNATTKQRNANWKEKIQDFSFPTNNRDVIVDLIDGNIVMTTTHTKNTMEKYALIYNKTKRKKTIISIDNFGNVTLPVPNDSYIMDKFNRKWTEYQRSTTSSRYDVVEHYGNIVYNKPFDEIFSNTNIEFIKPAKDYKLFVEFVSRDDKCKPISYYLNPNNFSPTTMKILLSSSQAWLEQLLRSGLYNIYCCVCEGNGQSGTNAIIEQKEYDNHNGWYNLRNILAVVNRKAKNLKEAFKLSLNQLKIIDVLIGEREKKNDGTTRWCTSNRDITIIGLNDWLGSPVNQLDLESFKYLVTKAADNNINFIYENSRCNKEVMELFTKESARMKLTDKMDWWVTIKSSGTKYGDYLRMRSQLQHFAELRNDPTIFNESAYPLRVGKAKRFIRYQIGQRVNYRIINTPEQFTAYVRGICGSQYADYGVFYNWYRPVAADIDIAEADKHIEYIYNADRLLGALVDLTPKMNLSYLHDELSFWSSFYQDESKNALFGEAIKRVKQFEFETEDLAIIAPESVTDLKREGEVLHHCVGSFVDPIINDTENVMFIRKKNALTEPYFTIAFDKNGNIEQCHCYANGALTEEAQQKAYQTSGYTVYKDHVDIVGFLKKWVAKVKFNKNTIHDTYGALCARR